MLHWRTWRNLRGQILWGATQCGVGAVIPLPSLFFVCVYVLFFFFNVAFSWPQKDLWRKLSGAIEKPKNIIFGFWLPQKSSPTLQKA